jgi:hypothetical protein
MIKVGDLVRANFSPNEVGLVLEWYDSAHGLVMLAYFFNGELIKIGPAHINCLRSLHESR